MSQGMQVFKDNGELLIDTSTFVGNFINSFTTTQRTGSVMNPLLSTGTPFAFATTGSVPLTDSGTDNYRGAPVYPSVVVSGSTLSWSWEEQDSVPSSTEITIFYGVF